MGGISDHDGHSHHQLSPATACEDPALKAIAEARLRAEDATALACMVYGAAVERASTSGPMCGLHLATRYDSDTASLEAVWYLTDDEKDGNGGGTFAVGGYRAAD